MFRVFRLSAASEKAHGGHIAFLAIIWTVGPFQGDQAFGYLQLVRAAFQIRDGTEDIGLPAGHQKGNLHFQSAHWRKKALHHHIVLAGGKQLPGEGAGRVFPLDGHLARKQVQPTQVILRTGGFRLSDLHSKGPMETQTAGRNQIVIPLVHQGLEARIHLRLVDELGGFVEFGGQQQGADCGHHA